ncbi:MAG: S9 family peptidase [Wenzhouxiangellaceae bacterium]
MNRALSALLLAAVSLAAITADAASPQPTMLQREDVFALEYADQAQWSPGGDQLVYERHFMDNLKDRLRSQLWVIDVASGQQQALSLADRDQRQPRWSPDGKRLAYLQADAEGRQQLFVRWMDSGREAQLTRLEHAPGGISWSPDGRWLAFRSFVPSPPEPMVKALAAPRGADWAPPPVVIDRPLFRRDGVGMLPQGHAQLFMVPAEGGAAVQLTDGPYPHGGDIVWSNDGQSLIFSARRHDDWQYQPLNDDLYRLQLSDQSITRLTDRDGPDHSPRLSADGRYLAWLGFDDQRLGYANTEVYLQRLPEGEIRRLSSQLDRDIDALEWSDDGKSLLIQYDDHGNGKIARLTLAGDHQVVAENVGGTSLGRPYGGGHFAVGRDDRLVYTHTTPAHPADLMMLADGRSSRLTELNRELLPRRRLARAEEIRAVSSHDERPLQGWIAYPPDYDPSRRYPLILEIHGGPFANYGDRFSAEVQLYAAAGYLVLYTNPRGSTSYGAEFANLIHHRYPGEDYDDLMSMVDAVIERGLADPQQLYVTGGSGGGVLTAWIIGKTQRFQAAAVAKPVINWTSFVLTGDMSTYFYRYWFPGLPWETPADYQRRSPLFLAGSVRTPTMVISGEADQRTPISEAEQYFQALQLQRIESVLVRVPDAPHYIAGRPSQLIAKVDHILAWFNTHRPQSED